jgi:hypothetical protein
MGGEPKGRFFHAKLSQEQADLPDILSPPGMRAAVERLALARSTATHCHLL